MGTSPAGVPKIGSLKRAKLWRSVGSKVCPIVSISRIAPRTASHAATEVEFILKAPSRSRLAAARFSVVRSELLKDVLEELRRLFGSGKGSFKSVVSVIPLKKYSSHSASFNL